MSESRAWMDGVAKAASVTINASDVPEAAASTFSDAVSELEMSQAELREVIARLVERLQPVSSPVDELDAECVPSEPRLQRSPVVEAIYSATARTKRMTRVVLDAHGALEV